MARKTDGGHIIFYLPQIFWIIIPVLRHNAENPPKYRGFSFSVQEKCKKTFLIYLILSKIDTARSSSRGYRWAYVFQVISTFAWPSRRAISWMEIPSLIRTEAWECRKSWIRICGKPAARAYRWFFFSIVESLRTAWPPQTRKTSMNDGFSRWRSLCAARISIRGAGNCKDRPE